MSKLSGKLAIVTGGNSGIGYASAKELKSQGATVIITGRNSERVKLAEEELGVKGMVADVKSISAIENLVEQVNSEFGKVDILFVNAGVFQPAPVGKISEELFDNQIAINFKGAVFTTEKFEEAIAFQAMAAEYCAAQMHRQDQAASHIDVEEQTVALFKSEEEESAAAGTWGHT